jgi:hypothetical protein
MKKKLTIPERISQEEKRLRESYNALADDKMNVVDGLIRRASYMRVALEDYEEDLVLNGSIEPFTQSEKTEPYDRERPVIRLYNAMNKNYQSIIKQLSDLLPKIEKKIEGDGFDEL